jgi:hypothetical protein
MKIMKLFRIHTLRINCKMSLLPKSLELMAVPQAMNTHFFGFKTSLNYAL